MHIHTTAATPAGDSLAGFQASQTAASLRRARELSDAASRIKARASADSIEEDSVSFAAFLADSPMAQSASLSQAVIPSIESRSQNQSGGSEEFADLQQRSAALPDSELLSSPSSELASRFASRASPFASESSPNAVAQKERLKPVSFWA
jgi:hypothetical protein